MKLRFPALRQRDRLFDDGRVPFNQNLPKFLYKIEWNRKPFLETPFKKFQSVSRRYPFLFHLAFLLSFVSPAGGWSLHQDLKGLDGDVSHDYELFP